LYDRELINYIESNKDELQFNLTDNINIEYEYLDKKGNSKLHAQSLIKLKHYTCDFAFKLSEQYFNQVVGYDMKLLSSDSKIRKQQIDNILFHILYDIDKIPDTNKVKEYVFNNHNKIYVDIKGSYTKQFNSSITFADRQSIVANRSKTYINKIIVLDNKVNSKCLFAKTFTPNKVIEEMKYKRDTNNNKVGDTKLKYKIVTIDDYIRKL
jgi:hypothetical protein